MSKDAGLTKKMNDSGRARGTKVQVDSVAAGGRDQL
jgi:hypothetical protein